MGERSGFLPSPLPEQPPPLRRLRRVVLWLCLGRELFDLLEATFAGDEGDGAPEEIEAAWLEEVEDRIASVERGESVLVDYEEAMARARRRIR